MGKKHESKAAARAAAKKASKAIKETKATVKAAAKAGAEKVSSATAKAGKAIKSAAPKKAPATRKPAASKPTVEAIQLRAYFVSEKRQREGRPGNPDSDWIEAERQLVNEAAAPKKAMPIRKPAPARASTKAGKKA